jgi:DNA-binding transcriptional regulator YdaS (Cro superfamily)
LPANRQVKRIDADSPLAWFQDAWSRIRTDASLTSKDLLDVEDLYGFEGFAKQIREINCPVPQNDEALRQSLSDHWYTNKVEVTDGEVFIKTDDDEVELAFWWMSQAVFQAKAEQFSVYATPQLPDGSADGSFRPEWEIKPAGTGNGSGHVYAAFNTTWDGGNLSGLPGPVRISGVLLPELVTWLKDMPPSPDHLLEIDWLSLVARAHPDSTIVELLHHLAQVSTETAQTHSRAIHCGEITEDALRADVEWFDYRERNSSVRGGQHHVELRLDDGFNYHVWILFDDVWASAHPMLARSILHFAEPV